MNISKETTDIIFNTIRIEEVIQDFISLKKRGANYLGLCPFHSEKTPSFTVSPAKEVYKCFGCGKSGNALNFIMEYKSYSYNESLLYVADKYQISISKSEEIYSNDEDIDNSEFPLSKILDEEIKLFKLNSSEVFKLMNFDSLVLEFCISSIEGLNERIKNNEEVKIKSPLLNADSTLRGLKGIAINKSMQPQYDSMYNQCLVLLVSYFSASAKEVFKKTIQYLIDENISFLGKKNEDIKLKYEELENANFNLRDHIADIIIDKKNISFQDMKSIARAFKDYFSVDIEKNIDVDNIILSLTSRHTIVHNLAIIDTKFIEQIASAQNRSIKENIDKFESIQFNPNEIKIIENSMIKYLESLKNLVTFKFKKV